MREMIFGYVRNIAFYIVFMNIILIIIPSNKYRGYIKTVLAFVLILIMIKPIDNLLEKSNGKGLEKIIDEYSVDLTKKEFEQGSQRQKELIIKQFENDFLNQINSIIEREDNNITAEKISISYLRENDNIIGIDNINIYIDKDCNKENIKNAISDFYNLNLNNINIIEETN